MPLGTEVGLVPGHIVLDGYPTPPKKNTAPLQFPAYVCCGQTAGLIKMPFGKEIGLGLGHVVLDGDSYFPIRRSAVAPPVLAHVYTSKIRGCALFGTGWVPI